MSYSTWSPNQKITGGALIAKLTYDNSLFIQFFKQVANNPDKKNNFDFKNAINIKFSEDEIGDLIRAVRTNGASKFYHTFKDEKTTGSFSFYEIQGEGGKPGRQGFGFTVNKGDATIKVGFSLGAAERFSEFLKFCLNKSFEFGYIDDLAKDKEYREKNKDRKTETKVDNDIPENSDTSGF